MVIEIISNGEAILLHNVLTNKNDGFIRRNVFTFKYDSSELKIFRGTNPFDAITIKLSDLDEVLFPDIDSLLDVITANFDYVTLIENLSIGVNQFVLGYNRTPLFVNVLEKIGDTYVSVDGIVWEYNAETDTLTLSSNVELLNAKINIILS
jgi:hypothetical protein